MKFFMSLLISGLVLGGTYGLIALGYSLIYKASGLMSFVQGDIMTLGAYLGLTFFNILLPICGKRPGFILAVLLTVLCAFLMGMLLERGVIRVLLSKNVLPIYVVLATIAFSYIIQNGAQLVWGSLTLNFPSVFDIKRVKLFGVNVRPEQILCTVASLIMCMESVFGALASALVLGERLTGREILGCAVMFAAILVSQLSDPITERLRKRLQTEK